MGFRPRWFLLLVFATGLSTGGFEIEEAEYKCESAVAHLADCCPGFEPSNYACYADGCSDVEADIAVADADCLRKKSCKELEDGGFCSHRIENGQCR